MLVKAKQREYRRIPSLNNMYEISSDGESFRNVNSKRESIIRTEYHHTLTGHKSIFITVEKKSKRLSVAKLVAECWLGEKPEGYIIHHIDGNTLNNDYKNLKYISRAEYKQIRRDEGVAKVTSEALGRFRKKRMKPIVILDGTNRLAFENTVEAAKYLSGISGVTVSSIIAKMKKKDSYIHNHTVMYLQSKLEKGE